MTPRQIPPGMDQPDQDDAKLAAKIIDAIKEVDAATATRNEKAIVAGKLLTPIFPGFLPARTMHRAQVPADIIGELRGRRLPVRLARLSQRPALGLGLISRTQILEQDVHGPQIGDDVV
jgi:hypothetical protein